MGNQEHTEKNKKLETGPLAIQAKDLSLRRAVLRAGPMEKTIKTGRDPNSLIKKRKNFTPDMIKQTEDLD